MIPRYRTPEMTEIWAEKRKFDLWLKIELAVLQAKSDLGRLDPDLVERIHEKASFSIKRIDEIDKAIHHDLLAFIQSVQEHLDPDDKSQFHKDMTSYDTEEIPTMLRIMDSINIIISALTNLREVIISQAKKYKKTLMIGRTHGQHAEPITFGLKLLGWRDMLDRDTQHLFEVLEEVRVGKLAGAVGTYGELDPEIEEKVCESLGLKPARHATQILHRDRIAHVMTTLTVLAGNIEHIALDFRLMSQTEICEVREPFGKEQKGSSRMPHKKNTIITEQLDGLPRLMRGYCVAAFEQIATWSERDISQSSVERIMLPDAFHLIHRMINQMTYVLKDMEVFPKNMERNLNLTRGCIHSGRVKDKLLGWGLDSEWVYRKVQSLCFSAMEPGGRHLAAALHDDNDLISQLEGVVDSTSHENVGKMLEELNSCFDHWQGLQHLDKIFARFGL